ncbi:unnamed protein product [Caenorhabditis auriculariae]|uniref:Uncharacterized protein n=1 Tax=Caenorhabditis auriculariae TaxID=2777116 RepID=A0A8S1HJ02_9PELO|nr:unnamed protein product [Caenorhabditis auriculariae]
MNEDDFWELPLAQWLRDCASGAPPLFEESQWRLATRKTLPLQYRELTDGVLLAVLFQTIDPSINIFLVNDRTSYCDSALRQKQLKSLFHAINTFYKARLQQLVVIASPDITAIARSNSPAEPVSYCMAKVTSRS